MSILVVYRLHENNCLAIDFKKKLVDSGCTSFVYLFVFWFQAIDFYNKTGLSSLALLPVSVASAARTEFLSSVSLAHVLPARLLARLLVCCQEKLNAYIAEGDLKWGEKDGSTAVSNSRRRSLAVRHNFQRSLPSETWRTSCRS